MNTNRIYDNYDLENNKRSPTNSFENLHGNN